MEQFSNSLINNEAENPETSLDFTPLSSQGLTLQRQFAELQALYEVSQVGNAEMDEDEIIRQVTLILSKQLFSDHIGVVLIEEPQKTLIIHNSYVGLFPEAIQRRVHPGCGIVGETVQKKKTMRINDVSLCPNYVSGSEIDMKSELCVPIFINQKVIGVINAESRDYAAFSLNDEQFLTTAAGLLANALHKAQLFKSERKRRLEAEVQREVGAAMTSTLDLTAVLDQLLIGLQKVVPYDSSAVFLLENRGLRVYWGRGFPDLEQIIGMWVSPEEKLFIQTQNTKKVVLIPDTRQDNRFMDYGDLNYIQSWMGVPLLDQGEVFGYFTLDAKQTNVFTPEMAEIAMTFANHAASAIMKARMFEKTKQQVAQLQVLHEIDQMITTSFDLKFTLGAFLEKLIKIQGVDAADILAFNSSINQLEYIDSRGFHTKTLRFTRLQLNQGFGGKVALTRRMISIPDLSKAEDNFSNSLEFTRENFVTYFGVPLIAKGEVKGVLEVFHRSPLKVSEDWLEFLHILATQAAIAMDNLQLFENLQSSNLELTLAYDSTLEGWAKTLELRDQETEGHSLRVTEIAVQLARAIGITPDELIHMRRGAMLHDIGKMGVPDRILQKPGPLTEEEWEIMKQHPVYAFNALYNIPFLKRAIEVPYFHHERWDGSGYPLGLSGASIPLLARIFAVVDVYDALTSDRPYRKAWSCEETATYIREQSGKHFDPQIVAAFLSLLSNRPCFQ